MNKLNKIKLDYQNGSITKAQFIQLMHEVHAGLFEYADFLKKTDIKKIEISDGLVIMTSRKADIKMICDKDDKRIAPIEILNFNNYEENDFKLVLKLIKNNFSVFDIGANFGWYSLNIAHYFPDCKVYSFEPILRTFNYLVDNIKLNNSKNIKLYNFGFSNEEKEIIFYYHPMESGNASLVNLSDSNKTEETKCLVKKMDDFIGEIDKRVDFIKCDVEGAELLVFQGAINSIEKYKPIIFTEILRKWSKKFNYQPQDIIDLLLKIGYYCFVSNGGRLKKIDIIDDNTQETNFFFLHSEKHSEEIINFS